MVDVGVRDLKQHLSEYLDRAERGELVRVTDRGWPKALLGPLPGRARVEEGIARGMDYAGLRWCVGARPSLARSAARPRCAGRGPRRVSLYVDSSALLTPSRS